MISDTAMRRALGQLALLRFFPGNNPHGLGAMAGMLAELCRNDAELARIAAEAVRQFDEWPGPASFVDWGRSVFAPAKEWRPSWEDENGAVRPECRAEDADHHPDPGERAKGLLCALAGVSGVTRRELGLRRN
jgi:hypothetical protein